MLQIWVKSGYVVGMNINPPGRFCTPAITATWVDAAKTHSAAGCNPKTACAESEWVAFAYLIW